VRWLLGVAAGYVKAGRERTEKNQEAGALQLAVPKFAEFHSRVRAARRFT
jgi:hypothetical protein